MSFGYGSNVITKTIFNCGGECTRASAFALTREDEASEVDLQYVLDNGTSVGEFARKLFPNAITIAHSTLSQQAEETAKLISEKVGTICEASFLKDNLFCAVDILEVLLNGHLKIIEVKSSTEIKDSFYRDVAFQVYVLRKCGYVVDSANLMYVNKDYIRNGKLNPKEYFIVTDISEDVFNLQEEVKFEVNDIKNMLASGKVQDASISEYCFTPYKCPFWETICKPELPQNSVFDIRGMRTSTKLKLFYDGIHTMSDYLKTKKQNPKYAQQCLLTSTGDQELQVNYEALNSFLNEIYYPITSLDFETIGEAIPWFDGQKPYAQTPVQFSMHVLKEPGGSLEHYEYIANPRIDWRIELAHKLTEYCPETGCVVVWNQTMEKHRIEELAELPGNEDVKEQLLSIASGIVDLMVPFRERVIYCEAMHGSYSIKHVLPALFPDDPTLSYEDLSINNGMLASLTFSKMLHDGLDSFDMNAKRQALFNYCELDTYGPFCILEFMFKLQDANMGGLFKKMARKDKTGRSLRVGDKVSTNVGNGKVIGFTEYFTRIMLDSNYSVLRKEKNIINLSGLDLANNKVSEDNDCYFCDSTYNFVKIGHFVYTDKGLGKVIGVTPRFLKIQLIDGRIIRRRKVTIIE